MQRQHPPRVQETASEVLVVMGQMLPHILLARLSEKVFVRGAAFWREHTYDDPAEPFFSYMYRLGQAPRSCIEQAIQHIHHALQANSCTQAWIRDAHHAEWWVHSREVEGAHPLHIDVDEQCFRQDGGGVVRSPLASSVIYLNANGASLGIHTTPPVSHDAMFSLTQGVRHWSPTIDSPPLGHVAGS
jgi:hypothetical protein